MNDVLESVLSVYKTRALRRAHALFPADVSDDLMCRALLLAFGFLTAGVWIAARLVAERFPVLASMWSFATTLVLMLIMWTYVFMFT